MGLCMKEMLIGADPFQIGALWKKMYLGTAMNGRRGMIIHAMSAIDMALWDLCGKAMNKPVHELLGGATRQSITPYASRQPAGHRYEEYRDALCASAEKAKSLGLKPLAKVHTATLAGATPGTPPIKMPRPPCGFSR